MALRGEKNPDSNSGGTLTLWVDGVKQESPIASNVSIIFETVIRAGRTETKVSSGAKKLVQGSTILVKWSNTKSVINLSSGESSQVALDKLGANACIRNKVTPAFDSCPHRYRYGYLEITSGSIGSNDSVADLNVVNILRLSDQYLYGLGEMPSSWHIEALKTQVIAARSFALIKSRTIQPYCNCNLDTTDGSQVFSGFSKEFAIYGDRWKQAVDQTIGTVGTVQADIGTQGQVIKAGSQVIAGYYSSSTGGMTQPRSEVWGTDTISWLVSVDDKWSQDPRVKNPNANWIDTISQETLVKNLNAKGINIPDIADIKVSSTYSSGGVKALKLLDSAGNVYYLNIGPDKDLSPDELRWVLGAKSTYILAISPTDVTVPGSPNVTAKKLKSVTKVNWPSKVIPPTDYAFSGKVSPAQLGTTVKLQVMSAGKWHTVSSATTNDRGSWSILWTGPLAGKHDLRITATNSEGSVKTSTNRVTMAGSISARSPKTAKRNATITVSGSVKPGIANIRVIVERKVGTGAWKKIATSTTDASGKWSVKLTAGSNPFVVSYRAKTTDARLGSIVSKTITTTFR